MIKTIFKTIWKIIKAVCNFFFPLLVLHTFCSKAYKFGLSIWRHFFPLVMVDRFANSIDLHNYYHSQIREIDRLDDDHEEYKASATQRIRKAYERAETAHYSGLPTAMDNWITGSPDLLPCNMETPATTQATPSNESPKAEPAAQTVTEAPKTDSPAPQIITAETLKKQAKEVQQ